MQNPILICGLQDYFSWSVAVPARLLYGNRIAELPEAFYQPSSSIHGPTLSPHFPFLFYFFTHSGTFQTTSSKGVKPSHRNWSGKKKLCKSRPKRKERHWTDHSTRPLPLIACGCAFTPSWVSCVSTHGPLCVKALGRRCSPPSLPTEPCCSSPHGILWSGR